MKPEDIGHEVMVKVTRYDDIQGHLTTTGLLVYSQYSGGANSPTNYWFVMTNDVRWHGSPTIYDGGYMCSWVLTEGQYDTLSPMYVDKHLKIKTIIKKHTMT